MLESGGVRGGVLAYAGQGYPGQGGSIMDIINMALLKGVSAANSLAVSRSISGSYMDNQGAACCIHHEVSRTADVIGNIRCPANCSTRN